MSNNYVVRITFNCNNDIFNVWEEKYTMMID